MVSVVIPARNEASTVGVVIDRVVAVLAGAGEVIVVDDGSSDATAQVVRDRALVYPELRLVRREHSGGKGTAVRSGLPLCRGRYVIFQDADLELDPAAYPILLAPLREGQADMVNGSRFLRGRAAAPWRTALANRVLTTVGNLAFGTCLTDLCSGHKAFRADLLLSLPLRARRYELESELVGLVARRGGRIAEVSTGYRPRTRSEGKRIGLRDGISVLSTVVRVRMGRS